MIPHLVLRPTPILRLINGIKGIEINKPKAKKNNATPICESFKSNVDLTRGRYSTQVPVMIFSEANTQAGAK